MFSRLWPLIKKELLQFLRNTPLLLIVLFSFTIDIYLSATGFSLDTKNVPIAVYDLDRSEKSRELIAKFQWPYFHLKKYISYEKEITELLDKGKTLLVLTIPPDFSQTIRQGKIAKVQILADATISNTALLALSYAAQIVESFSQKISIERLGLTKNINLPSAELQPTILFNPNLKSVYFMGLSELFSMITMIAILLPAAALVREKEYGTVEQLLVTPLHVYEILLGKIIAMEAIVLVALSFSIFSILHLALEIPLRGNLFFFLLVSAIYIFTASGLGIYISTISKNLSQAILATLLIIMPILFLSGSWVPLESMPWWMQKLTYLSPLKYYLALGWGIFLKGAGFNVLWKDFVGLVFLGAVIFLLGARRFREHMG
ncbi:MAG: ABC transporter permease [Candidatus Tectomicrobia bacterium]|uniref:Transport permease protein n=1 Tax=Tectimicrobiota bacterium TaxID=2528274 RepID=A0A933GLL1_UNCTE|nr:ABC transporter permease [Candidatus Tectomicrobia bacterium]